MNELTVYRLRASISMSLLYLVYWLFLRRETLFTVNRYYLLSALVLSMLLPLARINYPVAMPPEALSGDSTDLQVVPLLNQGGGWLSAAAAYLPVIYLAGVVLFFFRIAWQFFVLFSLVLKNGTRNVEGIRVVQIV